MVRRAKAWRKLMLSSEDGALQITPTCSKASENNYVHTYMIFVERNRATSSKANKNYTHHVPVYLCVQLFLSRDLFGM